jgi:hypothetical protein
MRALHRDPPNAYGPVRGLQYTCGCRPRFIGGIWSDRCRLCAGKRMRRHLNREHWGRCSTCKRVTRGMLDAARCRICWPLACHPERRR